MVPQCPALPLGRRAARRRATLLGATALAAPVAFAVLLTSTLPAAAQNWTGATSTDWFVGTNWSTGTAPATNASPIIDTTTPNATVVDGAAAGGPATANLTQVYIGYNATGRLTLQNGGQLTASNPILGFNSGSTGTVTVTGPSTLTSTGDLAVGEQGTGFFNVLNGGTVNSSGAVILGDCSCGIGTITVNGTGSTWTGTGPTYVGFSGTGTFNVENGGAATSDQLYVGTDTGSNGTVTVTGANSSWTSSTASLIGYNGTGTFNVLNAASASLGSISVGAFGHAGTLRVDATSSVTGSSYAQGSNGTYRVGLSQTTNGKVTITGGDIDLTNGGGGNGGTLQVDAKTTKAKTYTIMTTNHAVLGTFNDITVVGNANNLQVHYNASSITLAVDTFSVASQLPSGLTGNPKNVANALDNAINAGATFPDPFFDLFALTGSNLVNALSQLSGETAGGGAQAGTQLMNSFLSLLLNPFGGAPGGNPGTLGFAREFGAGEKQLAPEAAQAYAAVTPKDKRLDPVGQRWGVWGQTYGGYNKNNGDTTAGSHDTTARTYGLATGFDYRTSADTMVGFALAGGGTSWGLSDNLGTGRSDVLQFGLYGTKQFGAAYLSGALSYAWHGMSTDRTVTVSGSDHLTASFNSHSVGGRLETGYRTMTPFAGITPYAALQVQDFITPSYRESAASGSNAFALAYDSRSTVATRTELGAWLDKTIALDRGNVLAIRTRAAWANDHSSNQGLGAAFQTLPSSNFTVNGAAPATNLALLSAGAEVRLANNVSVGAKLDGEFSSHSQTYTGAGTVRYVW